MPGGSRASPEDVASLLALSGGARSDLVDATGVARVPEPSGGELKWATPRHTPLYPRRIPRLSVTVRHLDLELMKCNNPQRNPT